MPCIRSSLSLLAAAGTLTALVGCSTGAPESEGTADEAATRVVATDDGEVTVPADAERIVVLNANLAGYLYALDVDVLATIPETPGPGGGEYPESWAEEAAEDETVVLPWGEDGFDFEAILEQDPDLIIAGGQGYSAFHAADGYDRLTEIAPTVIVSSSLITWQEQLSFIAEDVLGESDDELVAAYEERVAEVSDAITLPELPVNYLVLTSDGTPFSLPEDSALPQTLAAVGIEPAAVIADNPDFEAYGTGDSFELSTEQVGQVFTAPSLFVFPFVDGEGIEVDALSSDPIYSSLPAFTAGQVYELPTWAYRADYLRTLDLLDYIEEQFS